MKLGAEQLPYLRRQLVAFERTVPGELWRREHFNSLSECFTEAMAPDDYVAVTHAELSTVPLYHVTEDMSQVCLAAARQLGHVERVSADDFPSPKGMILWSGLNVPIGWADGSEACAVRWSTATSYYGNGGPLIVVVWYYDRETRPDLVPPEATLVPRLVSYPDNLWELGEYDPSTDPEPPLGDRLLLATCLLMQQYVSQTTQEPQSRHSRKADDRAKIEPKPVTVIALRRVHREGDVSGDGEGRDYSHRWIVGGHWRNHWYPKRGVHRPVWIAPYVKGPDDKPLVLKERVTSLMR